MDSREIIFDSDKTFRRILSILIGFYIVVVILFHGMKNGTNRPIPSSSPLSSDTSTRIARLLPVPQKPSPVPAPLVKALPKVQPPPTPAPARPKTEKAERTEEVEKAAPPPKERIKKFGLLGLLGAKSADPAVSGFSSLKEIPKTAPNAPTEKKQPAFAQEEIDKIQRQALGEQERKITETRRAVVREDLSQAQVTPGSERTEEGISETVHENREKLLAIYNKMLQGDPNLRGNITVEFVISVKGEVLQCHVLTSSFGSPSFERALVHEILSWKFPPVSAGSTTVLYPLAFSPFG